MIKLFIILIFSLIAAVGISSGKPQQKDEKIHRFIFTLGSMQTPSADDAFAICKILVEQITKKNNLNEKTEVLISSSTEDLLIKSKNGFDLMIISTPEYLALRKALPLQPTFVASSLGHFGVKYLLVVNKNDNINEIGQLKNSDIRILGGKNQKTPNIVIDFLLRQAKLPPKELFFKSITTDPLTNNVVLPVFFKKVKAALVSETALNFISELNPQLKRDLKIIYSSPYLVATIACTNKNVEDPELQKVAYDILLNLHTEPFGRQLLDLFRVEKLIPYKEEYLTEYLKLLEK